MRKPLFIIGAFRSGTTAIANILNLSENADVYVEHPPKLSLESRLLYDGALLQPLKVLKDNKEHWIRSGVESGRVIGDKNANYLPFIPYLKTAFDCRFLFIARDGRSVVRSMMDWETVVPSNFYRRREDSAEYPDKSAEEDYWDYSLIRPQPGTETGQEWQSMSHFEKLCWYWAAYNRLMLEKLSLLEENEKYLCKMDQVNADDILEMCEFFEIESIPKEVIQNALTSRINTGESRGKISDPFPTWDGWSKEQQGQFRRIAGSQMVDLGYWPREYCNT